MALSISEVKEQIILILYDYMLTSDDESYWFSIAAIREGIDPDVSGAFVRIALKALEEDSGDVEEGFDDDNMVATYALTEHGILTAEAAIAKRGVPLREYAPAPSADRILSQIEDKARIQQIQDAISDIGRELRENNEVGAKLGDDKEIIAGEIEAAGVVVSRSVFRLHRLIALIVPALRYIADKFAGSALGETAKHLIKLLLES